MPTLLQINSCVNYGSTGRIAEEIGQVAIAAGWESYIAYGRAGRESKSQLIKIGSAIDSCEHAIETRIFDNHGFASRSATRKLIEQIKKIQPDVIHLHNIHGYYINIELLFNYLTEANIPVVWTLHDCWTFTGHCSYFDYAGCNKWMTGCSDCPQKTSYPASFLLDNSRRNYDLKKELFTSVKNMTIVPVSQWLGGLVKQSFLSKYPVKVIHNGVDLTIFHPISNTDIRKKYHVENNFLLIGVALGWGVRKGLADYHKLSELLPSDCVILLVGLSQQQIKQLPPNIIGIERTESKVELVKLYSAADIVLNLSYEETFGLTTVEGFACGTPGIVYNKTASPELMNDQTGFVVNAGDYSHVLAAIQEVKLRGKSAYSDACRKRAETCYNKDERFGEYMQLYNSVLNKI